MLDEQTYHALYDLYVKQANNIDDKYKTNKIDEPTYIVLKMASKVVLNTIIDGRASNWG